MSEIVRHTVTDDVTLANEMVEFVQIPVSSVVETMRDKKIVHGNHSPEEEILLLLHSDYPEYVPIGKLKDSLVGVSEYLRRKALKELREAKKVDESQGEYKLTQTGYTEAEKLMAKAIMA